MFKYYNSNLVKKHRSYNVEQICVLFKNKKLHAQTLRSWVNSGELEVISNKPILIYGEVLKAFLKARNSNHKKTLDFDQFKCIKCKEIGSPVDKNISVYRNKNGSFRAAGICPVCKHVNNRFYKKNEEQKLEKTFFFKKPDMSTLGNSLDSPYKTNLDSSNKVSSNEPITDKKENNKHKASKTNIKTNQPTLFDLL
jgi:hypothetical protein